MGEKVADEKIAFLREQYGLDKPLWQQYFVWVIGLLHGDLGYSFEYNQPVADVIGDRLFLTLVLNFFTVAFIYIVVVPDRRLFRHAPVQRRRPRPVVPRLPRPRHAELPARADPALFRQRLVRHVDRRPDGPAIRRRSRWSWAKVVSVLEHLWVPVVVIGTSRHGRHDPAAARQPARRTAEAICRRPRGPRACREGRLLVKLSAAHGAQPLHRRHRQPAAAGRLRLGHRLGRACRCRRPGRCCSRRCRARTCISPARS